jgi:hypothetical protein
MNKVATILTAVLIAGFAAVKMSDMPAPAPLNWMDEQEFRERLANYQCFKQTLEETLISLGKAEINLKEAHARVCGAARRFQPDYLEHLTQVEPGATDAERVAHNLVGHLRSVDELEPRARALETELHEIHDESAGVKRAQ